MGTSEGDLPLSQGLDEAVLTRIGNLAPRPGGLALLVGDGAAGDAPELERRGWRVHVAASEPDFGVPPHSVDLVLGSNLLARDPWERWALQRMHRALKPGGVLALSEPNRLDLSTPGGLAWIAGRALVEAGRRFRPRDPGTLTPAGRRPSATRLQSMLEQLRFAEIDLRMDRRTGLGHLLPPAFAARISVVARTRPSVAGIEDEWPARAPFCADYERRQHVMLETRKSWIAANPRRVAAVPAPFDATAYAGKSIVMLAPHPDDEVIGAGGALLRLVRAGARVTCVQATDGSAGAALFGRPETERRTRRLEESSAVSRAMGFAELECWRADNHHFRPEPELVSKLAVLLERERPALVFVPFVTDAHEDHVTLAVILARALKQLATPLDAQVLSYEVWSLAPPSLVHDVTPLMTELERLLFVYDTAMRVDDFVHYCADRALYHGYTLGGAPAYLESFFALHARDYPDLVNTVRPPHDA